MDFLPEGALLNNAENRARTKTLSRLSEFSGKKTVIEARASKYLPGNSLFVNFGDFRGVIPYTECAANAGSASFREISVISRVGKPICFYVSGIERISGEPVALLSRRLAQEDCLNMYLNILPNGEIIPARITHIEPFGCFADIGRGIISMLPTSLLCISRIAHPAERFSTGDDIYCAAFHDEKGRIRLSQRELLGTWAQNAALFSAGTITSGIVRKNESYGSFIELTPNLCGLSEPDERLHPGMAVSVYIKSIIPQKFKVKLAVIEILDGRPPESLNYFTVAGNVSDWDYHKALR